MMAKRQMIGGMAAPLCLVAVTLTVMGLSLDAAGEGGRLGSVSVGHPNRGKLIRGKRLPDKGRGFYSNPKRPNAEADWGTDETIHMLIKAGRDVAKAAPGGRLAINDISFEEGGNITHHASHRVGRDVDLMFFSFNTSGDIAEPICIPYDAEGKAVWDGGTPHHPGDDEPRIFDARRNWLTVRSLVEHDVANVQRIYVAEHIRTILLDHAQETGQPDWVIERAGDLMCQPGPPHDDHFHVRLFCTAQDYRQGCRDRWPLYPWRRTELAELGLTNPQLVRPRKRRRSARKKALSRATKRTSPGRLWCP